MANSRSNGVHYEYATVDTAPGPSGYWTEPVRAHDKSVKKIFFSIRETDLDDSSGAPASDIVVTLQFKCPGDVDWQDYYNDGADYEIGQREVIEDSGAGVVWRAGVKDQDYTSGSVTFGFDW